MAEGARSTLGESEPSYPSVLQGALWGLPYRYLRKLQRKGGGKGMVCLFQTYCMFSIYYYFLHKNKREN